MIVGNAYDSIYYRLAIVVQHTCLKGPIQCHYSTRTLSPLRLTLSLQALTATSGLVPGTARLPNAHFHPCFLARARISNKGGTAGCDFDHLYDRSVKLMELLWVRGRIPDETETHH